MTYLELLLCDDAFVDEFLDVKVENCFLLSDRLVHLGLSEERVVLLVVTVPSVAHLNRNTKSSIKNS